MTLAQLRTLARQRADMENSRFVTDAEVTSYVNLAYGELYDLLVSAFEDYYMKDPPFTFTLTSSNKVALPADFYKLRGLDYQLSSNRWADVRLFNFQERNKGRGRGPQILYRPNFKSYRVMGSNLYILPEDDASGTYRMWYTPRFTRLVNDSDAMSDVLDFEEYVIVGAAIMMLNKEESDPSALMAIKQGLVARIDLLAKARDSAEAERVADVSGINGVVEDFYLGN